VAQGRVHCVLPRHIGEVVVAPLERAQVRGWFAGLAGAVRRRGRGRAGAPAV